jgi:heterodisulfide reductase subunit B
MCHVNLDMRQLAVQSAYEEDLNIPVLYLSELIGLALGLDRASLGIKKHFIHVPEIKAKPVEPKESKPKVRKPAAAETKA